MLFGCSNVSGFWCSGHCVRICLPEPRLQPHPTLTKLIRSNIVGVVALAIFSAASLFSSHSGAVLPGGADVVFNFYWYHLLYLLCFQISLLTTECHNRRAFSLSLGCSLFHFIWCILFWGVLSRMKLTCAAHHAPLNVRLAFLFLNFRSRLGSESDV